MSHNIEYQTYRGTRSLKEIEAEVLEIVRHKGDNGTDHLQTPTDRVFDSYDEAVAYIEKIDRHWYDGFAVKYRDLGSIEDNAKIKELRAKIGITVHKKNEYIAEHSVRKQKAAYIGCSLCGSKLNKQFLKGEHCPLCFTDLRAPSTLERIASFDKRVKDYDAKITAERLKQKDKAPIDWLVKYEYHT